MLSVAHLVTSTYSRPFLVHWKRFLLEAPVSPCLRAFCSCRSMLSWKSSRMNNSWCSKLQPLMNNYLSFLVPWDDHSELCSTQFFSGSLVDMCSSCPQWQPINSPFTGFPPCPGWFHSLSWVSWTHSQASYISPNSCLWPAFRGTQASLQTLAPPTGLQTVVWTNPGLFSHYLSCSLCLDHLLFLSVGESSIYLLRSHNLYFS